jgi:hypothetical protein
MGKYENGILGAFYGKVGDVVGANWNPGKKNGTYYTGSVEYDISSQMDGLKSTFNLPVRISANTPIAIYYAGMRLVKNINYDVNISNNTVTVLFSLPPDANEGRRLIIVAG